MTTNTPTSIKIYTPKPKRDRWRIFQAIADWAVEPYVPEVAAWEVGHPYDPSLRWENAYGIKVLNDKTSGSFVITLFMDCFQLSERKATKMMLKIHNNQHVVLGRMNKDDVHSFSDHLTSVIKKADQELSFEIHRYLRRPKYH